MSTDTTLTDIPLTDLYIDGQWVRGANDNRIPVYNPATEAVIAHVADADIRDAIKCVDAADKASAQWASTPPRQRAEVLRRCWQLMIRDADKIAHLITLENGKSRADAKAEALYAAEFFRWFSEEAVRERGVLSTAPSGVSRIMVTHQPIGISLLITPWNYPAAMATRKIAPALAAGCTCILKPATETPLTAYVVAAILAEAGVPAGVVNVITTSQTATVVHAILDDTRVRKVSFTGSTQTGQKLLAKAAERVVSPSMELGGNAPFIVCADADIDKAVDGLMVAKMRNGGLACTAANRIFVHRDIADALVPALSTRMRALKMGNPQADDVDVGALTTRQTVEKVTRLVDNAVAQGATVLCGGSRPQGRGYFYPPTVLTDVPDSVDMRCEEIFGPVAPIYIFDDEDAVIDRANDTQYGLIAYVYTKDMVRGMQICERLEAGMVALNRGVVSDPAAPFGGVKQSGLGREGADHGMLEFMEVKYISTEW